MFDFRVRQFLAGLVLVLFVASVCCGGEPDQARVGRLHKAVAECERQLTRSQRELAQARAQLALAEKKRNVAITHLHQVVACCESEVQWLKDHASWFCDPREQISEAQWQLAKARLQLAEVEGDAVTQVAQWQKMVGFHEERVQRMQRLAQLAAVSPEEVSMVQQALGQAREHLAAAEKRLAAEQAHQPRRSK